MLYVCNLAGEELAALDAEELHDVKHLKKVLDQRLGVSRFHQRLLQGGALLEDHVTLTPVGFDTVQLVVAPFVEASREDVEMLIESSRRGRIVDLEMMLQQPYDPNLQRADGDYALLAALRNESGMETVRLLLEARANPNLQNALGDYALLAASSSESGMETVRLLLEARADPNLQCANGDHALLAALSSECRLETVRLLLEARADPNLVTDGSSPLQEAFEAMSAGGVRLLLEAGAQPTKLDYPSKFYDVTARCEAKCCCEYRLDCLFKVTLCVFGSWCVIGLLGWMLWTFLPLDHLDSPNSEPSHCQSRGAGSFSMEYQKKCSLHMLGAALICSGPGFAGLLVLLCSMFHGEERFDARMFAARMFRRYPQLAQRLFAQPELYGAQVPGDAAREARSG
ncbi:Putative ankyrin repeat protein RBE_0997 [Durusdinium trenchii]|uniref:Ankyrin repeat protein RBE_0997 n=1 Tax=Durusdinium trenchii TaxID=1381693 RepID=A0ABP0M6D1_9DINO